MHCYGLPSPPTILSYPPLSHPPWLGGVVVSVEIERSRVRLSASAPLGNNCGQVANTHVPLSPSSTIWYQPKGGDALRPGR